MSKAISCDAGDKEHPTQEDRHHVGGQDTRHVVTNIADSFDPGCTRLVGEGRYVGGVLSFGSQDLPPISHR